MPLTERDKAILDFERSWWTTPGDKESAIEQRFELSVPRYHAILSELLDSPEALAHDPLVVRRLQRQRAARQRARTDERSLRDGAGR